MKIGLYKFLIPFFVAFFLFAFKKEPTEPAKQLFPLFIQFDNIVGEQDLVLNDKEYGNQAGEAFTISQLQYFVSNIRLRCPNGKEFVLNPDSSYFLVQEHDPSTQTIRLMVPPDNYERLSFVLGVDSLRNTMNISKRTGVLDPSSSMDNGMYWSWNSGYIFMKMEGNSPAAPADPTGNRKFRFHIGGFGGYSAPTINNIKTIELDLRKSGLAKPGKGKNATIRVKADILKTFDGAEKLSIAAHPSVMFSQYSVKVANNYSAMFSTAPTQN